MSISDTIFRPFETLIRPLDIPFRPLPSKGPVAVLLHFIAMFRGVLIALALSSMAVEAINLSIIWGLSVIVDGVTAQGATAFLRNEWPLLTVLGLLIFPAMPIASFLLNTLNSHTLGIAMPAAIQLCRLRRKSTRSAEPVGATGPLVGPKAVTSTAP